MAGKILLLFDPNLNVKLPHHSSCIEMDAPPESVTTFLRHLTVRRWSTLASLAILLYEYLITLDCEVRYIWRRPITVIRSTYFFSRYVGIALQSINLYLVFGPLSSLNLEKSVCKQWFAAQMSIACLLMAALDYTLMLRVYALYRKDWRVGTFLSALFIGQLAVHSVLGPMSFDEPVSFDSICTNTKPPQTVLYFGISLCIKYTSLALLSALKYNLVSLGAPVVNLVMGDGAFVMGVICLMWAILVPYCLLRHVGQGHVIFGWTSTIMSICCCRLIMNLQKLEIGSPESESASLTDIPELTILHYDPRDDSFSRGTI